MQPFGGTLNAISIFKARIARSRFMRLLTVQLLPDSGLPLQTMRGRSHALNAGPSLSAFAAQKPECSEWREHAGCDEAADVQIAKAIPN